jgi:hypothetical protein
MNRRKDNRVAEYFTVAGLDKTVFAETLATCSESSFSIYNLSFEPRILHSYPSTEGSSSFPEGIEYFCFPDGIYLQPQKLPPQFHSFIHTSEDGSRLIGCSFMFYEELETSFHEILVSHALIGAREIIYRPKSICIISQWPFIYSFEKFLYSLYELTQLNRGSAIPIERFICNFIDDVPTPPPGKVDVNYFIGEKSIRFQCPPMNEPNVWTGFPLFPLFDLLSVENVCAILSLLLVERQVVFISSSFDSLTLAIGAVTSLLYPFKWVQALIPILPRKLISKFYSSSFHIVIFII